jgi:hypothetical protein
MSSGSCSGCGTQMLAICMVIVDQLHHEAIWQSWISQGSLKGSKYRVRLFIQAKNPEAVASDWVRQFLIPMTFRPAWNSPEVVRAMLGTLDTALQYLHDDDDDDNGHYHQFLRCERFLFCTEYCLPLRSLTETGDLAFAQDRSWLTARHEAVDSWEQTHCFQAVDQTVIPPAVRALWLLLL